jgi:tetratricopeptide (TPR) repeat protein
MRNRYRQHSLLTSILILMVTISTLPTCLGVWDYYGLDHPKLTPEMEQRMWYWDAYSFLHSDDDFHFYPNVKPIYYAPTYSENINYGSPRYWLDDANKLYLIGSYEEAAKSYAKAVNIDPSLLDGWLNLGNSLYFLGRYQASLNAYETVLQQDPQNANAKAGKNQALLALNNIFRQNNPTIASSTDNNTNSTVVDI